MSRSSKKRAVFTLVDYKGHKAKRHKSSVDNAIESSSCRSNPTASHISSVNVVTTNHSTPQSKHYVITDPQYGIDMYTFRLSLFSKHEIRSNISAIIRKTQNYKFIELAAPVPVRKQANHRRITTQRSPSRVAVHNQPKIVSFLSTHASSSNSNFITKSSIVSLLHNKSRCVVEDFMTLKEGIAVVLLVPQITKHQTSSFKTLLCNNKDYNIVQFGPKSSTKYHLIPANVKSNIHLTKLSFNLLEMSEVTSAFTEQRNNGYGLSFNLVLDDTFNIGSNKLLSRSIEIRWFDVLHGRTTGLQVWSELDKGRDYSLLFKSKFNSANTDDTHLSLLSFIYEEICLDTPAVFNLLSRYYHEQSLAHKNQLEKLTKQCSKTVTNVKNFNRDNYITVHNEIETIFSNAIKHCYGLFTEITSPILNRSQILQLIDLYKEKLNVHYHVMKEMFGFDRKELKQRNDHLVQSHHYDRLIFYQYMSQSRVRFNHYFTYWGIINTCAIYGKKGEGQTRSQSSSFFGHTTTFSTMMKKTTELRQSLDSTIKETLKEETKIVCCIDNNQKGNSLKYQRFGHCNKYIKVTGSVIIKYNYCEPIIHLIDKKAALTYSNQKIPSPYLFPHFEKLIDTNSGQISSYNTFHLINDITRVRHRDNYYHNIYPTINNEIIDISGRRVQSYMTLLSSVQTLDLIQKTCSGCYNATNKAFRFVPFTDEEWKNPRVKLFLMYFHSLKPSLLNTGTSLFQYNTVLHWNKNVKKIMKVIVPRVFLYDEITTDGYGKCLIELMTMHGILEKKLSQRKRITWELGENWDAKTIV